MSDLADYFDKVRGTGVLATADGEGRVNVALYARPRVMGDGTLAFVVNERLTRQNLEQNPHAAHLVLQEGAKRAGDRLSLARMRESSDPELVGFLARAVPVTIQ